jgi:membrane protein required for colicin V production
MTALDYLILAIFLIFAVWGMVRGLIAEVFSLVSWIAALYIGSHYGEVAVPLLESTIDNVTIRKLLASFAIGILTFAIVSIIGVYVSRAIQASVFGPLNRMLGLLFGAARGALVIAVFVLIGLQFGIQDEAWWQGAKLQPAATVGAHLLDSVVDFDALMKSQTFIDVPQIPRED